MNGVRQVASVAPGELVRPFDTLVLPIRPIDVVFEDRYGEYVRQLVANDVPHVRTVQVRDGDVVQLGIGPDDLVHYVVDCQSVWPAQQFFVNDMDPLRPVHTQATDVGIISPIRIKQ